MWEVLFKKPGCGIYKINAEGDWLWTDVVPGLLHSRMAGKPVGRGNHQNSAVFEKSVSWSDGKPASPDMHLLSAIFEKLAEKAGESIAEVLVSLLISTVALTMLAGMITSASRIVLKSDISVQQYVEQGNGLVQFAGSGEDGTATISIKSSGDVYVDRKLTDETDTVPVTCYVNSAIGNVNVTAYKVKE